MAVIHSYRCRKCRAFVQDSLGYPDDCQCGSNEFEITFEDWRTLSCLEGGTARDSLVDSKGNRKKFNASEDPLVLHELCMEKGHGIRSFSDDQTLHYTEKLLVEGDTPKLRDEILKVRAENLKKSE